MDWSTFAAAVAAFQVEPEGLFAVDPAGRMLAAAVAVEGSDWGASFQPIGSESTAVVVAAVAAAVVVVVVVVADTSFAWPLDQEVSLRVSFASRAS